MNPGERIRALIGDRTSARPWYQINAAADGDASPTAEILIYDEIDSWFGVSAEQFVRDLAAVDADQINVRINSPGGDVFDGIAIMNAIRGHSAKVVTYVDGLAASAASVIALAGDEVVMRPGTEMMIHEAWGVAVGDAQEMRGYADRLDRIGNTMAGLYAEKTGASADEMRALMQAETWFTADEAVEAGLADRVEKPTKDKAADASAKARFDLSVFNYAGRRAAPAPRLTQTPSARIRAEVNPGERRATVPTLIEGLRATLGLAEDADEATVLAAVAARTDSAGAATEDAPADPSLQQIVAAAGRLGLRLVDAERYEETERQAAQGAAAFKAQQEQHRNAVLDSAIRTGRISAAQRATYAAQLERDPKDTEEFLNGLPPNMAVPLEEIGHSGEPDVDQVDAEFAGAFAKITGSDWKA